MRNFFKRLQHGAKHQEMTKMHGELKIETKFDDTHIPWKEFGVDDILYHIYRVDEEKGIVDGVFKFPAKRKIFLHRHLAEYATLVMHGELRLYHPSGELKEVRPTGSYVLTKPGAPPHTEGGGDVDAIVLFSFRGTTGALFDILHEQTEQTTQTVSFDDVKALFAAQAA